MTAEELSAMIDATVEAAVERVLERKLPELPDDIADAVLFAQTRRRVELAVGPRYPAQDVAAWLRAKFDVAKGDVTTRSNFSRWQSGEVRWARQKTIERVIEDLGGTPAELRELDELSEEVGR